eukprot:gnl/Hemi2/6510_TR2220_c0_g22_i1.p1 gnl/Hemi2/6510_TR2220_c0_g22~~gnl/Hemi2/6510_TR2220_c0_g22_i1.p1  ORF type:complete len:145 (-),score=33.42 gnl/Hemi2/6510_TR2220_c0_g22_i1:45-479(-)
MRRSRKRLEKLKKLQELQNGGGGAGGDGEPEMKRPKLESVPHPFTSATPSLALPRPIVSKPQTLPPPPEPQPETPAPRVYGVMTPQEFAKQSNKLQRVFEPETGRTRLTRGGEIIEEIVSKERHKEIQLKASMWRDRANRPPSR